MGKPENISVIKFPREGYPLPLSVPECLWLDRHPERDVVWLVAQLSNGFRLVQLGGLVILAEEKDAREMLRRGVKIPRTPEEIVVRNRIYAKLYQRKYRRRKRQAGQKVPPH